MRKQATSTNVSQINIYLLLYHIVIYSTQTKLANSFPSPKPYIYKHTHTPTLYSNYQLIKPQPNYSLYPSIYQKYIYPMSENQKAHASPQVNPYGRVDESVASVAERDERRKKRLKCLAYLVAFIAFQSVILLIFGLTIMKVRTPKFRVRSATFDTFDVATLDTNPSFNIRMIADLGIKNANFGKYKYQNSTVVFFYRGTRVGEAVVARASAKARGTRRFVVAVDLSSAGVPVEVLANEFRNGAVIPLRGESRLRGKVEIMKVMKKNKSTNMNCTMDINISSRQLQNLLCR